LPRPMKPTVSILAPACRKFFSSLSQNVYSSVNGGSSLGVSVMLPVFFVCRDFVRSRIAGPKEILWDT
jgi:hypothetical protein